MQGEWVQALRGDGLATALRRARLAGESHARRAQPLGAREGKGRKGQEACPSSPNQLPKSIIFTQGKGSTMKNKPAVRVPREPIALKPGDVPGSLSYRASILKWVLRVIEVEGPAWLQEVTDKTTARMVLEYTTVHITAVMQREEPPLFFEWNASVGGKELTLREAMERQELARWCSARCQDALGELAAASPRRSPPSTAPS